MNTKSIEQMEGELYERLERIRLDRNISQSALAEAAGVSRRTISRMENGEGVSVNTLLRIAKALDQLPQIDRLFKMSDIRPIDQVKQRPPRQKASPRKKTSAVRESKTKWEWGDSNGS